MNPVPCPAHRRALPKRGPEIRSAGPLLLAAWPSRRDLCERRWKHPPGENDPLPDKTWTLRGSPQPGRLVHLGKVDVFIKRCVDPHPVIIPPPLLFPGVRMTRDLADRFPMGFILSRLSMTHRWHGPCFVPISSVDAHRCRQVNL